MEHGLLSEQDFRDFVYGFPLALWGGTNPDFFRGTVIQATASPPRGAA